MKLPLSSRNYSEGKLKVCTRVNHAMIVHKHYKAFIVYLQLKPLYVSGTIMNQGGNYAYEAMANYLGISQSGLRGKIRQLKKYNLISIDKNKNFHLASYRRFVNVLKPQKFRRVAKETFANIAGADQMIKAAMVAKNYRAQAFMIKKKILESEVKILVGAPKDRLTYPEQGNGTSDGCSREDYHWSRTESGLALVKNLRKKRSKYSRPVRRLRAELMKDYENLLWRYRQYYAEEIQVIENGYPAINPHITISCAGVGRLLGLSANGGFYQRNKMIGAGVMSIVSRGNYAKVFPVTPGTKQAICESGGNVFSYQYRTRKGNTGFVEKFHLSLPDELKLHPFFS